jgi:hypothetical protein
MIVSRLLLAPAVAAALVSCATGGSWPRMQAEFPEVSANCGLSGTYIERDRRDRRLLHLVFRHRSNMALQARQDGRFACAQLWAEEQGWRLTTAPDHDGAD